jgi:hypothetical protein
MSSCSPRLIAAPLVALLLAACAGGTTQLVSQWKSPEFAGPPLKRVFVVAHTQDRITRRVLEDALVAELGARGAVGVQSYRDFPASQAPGSAAFREAVRAAQADGVLLTRADAVDEQTQVVPGAVVPVYVGVGWDSFYNLYDANYVGNYVQPPEVSVTRKLVGETRVFDTRRQALVWSGTTQTPLGGSTTTEERVDRFARTVVDAIARAGII